MGKGVWGGVRRGGEWVRGQGDTGLRLGGWAVAATGGIFKHGSGSGRRLRGRQRRRRAASSVDT